MNKFSTIDREQIEHFSKESKEWWNKNGPFKPLHKINPGRLTFIKKQICDFYELNPETTLPLKELNILDIGCGGGLVCEHLAQLGANVTGLDADHQAIETAKEHAENKNIKISYLNDNLETIKQKFDVVLALEILEHINDASLFIEQCTEVLNPGGLLIISTLNRTPKSFVFGIVAAEYIMHWVSKGTHSWDKFIKPSELSRYARTHNLRPLNISGLVYNPLKDNFTLSENNCEINYIMSFIHKT